MKSSNTIITAIVCSVLAAFITVKVTTPKGVAESKHETAYERVLRTKTIRCGYAQSAPQLMKDGNTGKITGVDRDLWDEIGRQLDLKIEWTEEAGWGNFIEGLRSNRYDVFCSHVWPDYARVQYLTMSIPFLYSYAHTYVRADDHRFDGNLEAINNPGVTIPALEGDVTMMLAQTGFPKAKILPMPQLSNVSDMFMSLTSKKADAVFLEPAMFQVFDKNNKGVLREVANVPPAFILPSYFGFNSGDYQLRDMVNIALRSLIDNGKVEKIAHSYSPDYIIAKKNFNGEQK